MPVRAFLFRRNDKIDGRGERPHRLVTLPDPFSSSMRRHFARRRRLSSDKSTPPPPPLLLRIPSRFLTSAFRLRLQGKPFGSVLATGLRLQPARVEHLNRPNDEMTQNTRSEPSYSTAECGRRLLCTFANRKPKRKLEDASY